MQTLLRRLDKEDAAARVRSSDASAASQSRQLEEAQSELHAAKTKIHRLNDAVGRLESQMRDRAIETALAAAPPQRERQLEARLRARAKAAEHIASAYLGALMGSGSSGSQRSSVNTQHLPWLGLSAHELDALRSCFSEELHALEAELQETHCQLGANETYTSELRKRFEESLGGLHRNPDPSAEHGSESGAKEAHLLDQQRYLSAQLTAVSEQSAQARRQATQQQAAGRARLARLTSELQRALKERDEALETAARLERLCLAGGAGAASAANLQLRPVLHNSSSSSSSSSSSTSSSTSSSSAAVDAVNADIPSARALAAGFATRRSEAQKEKTKGPKGIGEQEQDGGDISGRDRERGQADSGAGAVSSLSPPSSPGSRRGAGALWDRNPLSVAPFPLAGSDKEPSMNAMQQSTTQQQQQQQQQPKHKEGKKTGGGLSVRSIVQGSEGQREREAEDGTPVTLRKNRRKNRDARV
jgi:hypothetical protein